MTIKTEGPLIFNNWEVFKAHVKQKLTHKHIIPDFEVHDGILEFTLKKSGDDKIYMYRGKCLTNLLQEIGTLIQELYP